MKEFYKNNRTAVIVIIVLVIILVAAIVYNKLSAKSPATDYQFNPGNGNNNNSSPGPAANDSFPLQKGSIGEDVKRLQRALNRIKPSLYISEDGSFGQKTYTALLLGVGTHILIGDKKVLTYPVSQAVFTEILKVSNNIKQ